jgi:hypothetical protein
MLLLPDDVVEQSGALRMPVPTGQRRLSVREGLGRTHPDRSAVAQPGSGLRRDFRLKYPDW